MGATIMDTIDLEKLQITRAGLLPIAREYTKRLMIRETVNELVDSQMNLAPGDAICAMVIDAFSGRTPLCRFTDEINEQDSEILFGFPVNHEMFSETNLGRAMDRVYEAGAQRLFTEVSMKALSTFDIDAKAYHFDTTSVSVYGDYELQDEEPSNVTYGHSKAKRPDLKQFMVSMCCVERNIPIIGQVENGNASDKTLNNKLLSSASAYMARHGLETGASLHIADSAFVTALNLEKARDLKIDFLSRMPANFKECKRVIDEAVKKEIWQEVGILANDEGTIKKPSAYYRAQEGIVDVEGHSYRAITYHSSAYDKRRQKTIENQLKKDRTALEKTIHDSLLPAYKCRGDAESARKQMIKLASKSMHTIETEITETPVFERGRPKKGETRVARAFRYELSTTLHENPEKTKDLRTRAGCFVLLTSLNDKGRWSPSELLRLYKEQDGIEKNFGFIKDPAIINAIFLKKTSRIEVLGLVLLLALLIWRLIERDLRQHIKKTSTPLPGWKPKGTTRPTTFMMSIKFKQINVLTIDGVRRLARPLKPEQLKFLEALKLTPNIYTIP